jgi:hypothetical protein
MTSLAVDMSSIDDGLIARYTGINIDVAGVPTAVEVFMEDPHPEVKTEKEYPSIALNYIGHVFDESRAESSDDDLEEVSLDTGVDPYERVERKGPLPYNVLYSLHTWHKEMVNEDRELGKKVFEFKTPPRGYMTIKNIDNADVNVDVHRVGNVVNADEKLADVVIYHKIQTLEVQAYLTQADAADTTRSKVAMRINWKFFNRKLLETPSGTVEVPSEKVLDVEVQFDGTDEGPV